MKLAEPPVWIESRCYHCGGCVPVCPVDALVLYRHGIEVGPECTGCGICLAACPNAAFSGERA